MSARRAGPRGSSSGLRREVTLLFPVAWLLIIALSTYTLLSYRGAIAQLLEQRREEVLAAARSAAGGISAESPLDETALSRHRPPISGIRGVVVFDASGRQQVTAGETTVGALSDGLGLPGAGAEQVAQRVGSGVVVGPDGRSPDGLLAVVPWVADGETRYLALDVGTPVLASRQRELRVLTVLVLGVGGALFVLLLLFVRRLTVPFDRLVERVRRVRGAGELDAEEDVELLIRTFERGIAAMAQGGEVEGRDEDIAALERTLAESLESGLLLLDRKGRTLALNPVGAELLGVQQPPPGTPVGEVLAPHPQLAGLLTRAIAEPRPIQREEIGLDGPAGRRTLGLTLHPLRVRTLDEAEPEKTRQVRGFLVLFADLTEVRRKADEERLADRLLGIGELAAGVAHEMRNGLATLQGYLALLQRSPDDAPQSYLGEMRRETDHLHRVLSDFLSFARPGSVRAVPIRPAELLRQAAADPALGGAAVRVSSPPGEQVVLSADPQLLERALRNLIQNAVEASREGAEEGELAPVLVSLTVVDEVVEIAVEDRGPGIPADLRDRVFDPFVTGRQQGVGLGLALAHRIVHLHGGTLELRDRAGGGTVARLRLPIVGAADTIGNSS